MNREILFRGQTRKKGEKVRLDGSPADGNWVYGGIFPGKERSVIYTLDPVEKYTVCSETVGQYTGLTDKNGKKIFEGDIAKDPDGNIYAVKWQRYSAAWEFYSKTRSALFVMRYPDMFEVIGNVFDNQELLEEEHK